MRKSLKIVHFSQFLGIGGLEKVILELALLQKEMGHDVTIVVYDYEREWVDYFIEKGLKVITSIKKEVGFDKHLPFQLKRYIEKENFDIVHTHDINPLIYLTLAKILIFLKRAESFKLVHTAHTLDHVENSKKVEFFERLLAPFANQIIAVSPRIQNFYLKKVLLRTEKVHYIENGISQKIAPQEIIHEKRKKFVETFNLDPEKPLGLSLSRVVPLKDQLFLIQMFMECQDNQLIIAGPPSDPDYFKMLESIINQNSLKNIKLIGARSDVLELNQMCDFYVSASTHEGLPISVLESMSVGNPCLVSDIPGHKVLNQYQDVIEFYKIHDAKDFKRKLKVLIRNLENEKYKNGIGIVEKYFSTKRMAKRYNEVYFL